MSSSNDMSQVRVCNGTMVSFTKEKWLSRYDWNFDKRAIAYYDDTSKQGFKENPNHLASPINEFAQSFTHISMLTS